jgi:hypothetical protein
MEKLIDGQWFLWCTNALSADFALEYLRKPELPFPIDHVELILKEYQKIY